MSEAADEYTLTNDRVLTEYSMKVMRDAFMAGVAWQRAQDAPKPVPEDVWDYAEDGELMCMDEAPLGGNCILKPGHTGRHRGVYTSWDRYSDDPEHLRARRIVHQDPEWASVKHDPSQYARPEDRMGH